METITRHHAWFWLFFLIMFVNVGAAQPTLENAIDNRLESQQEEIKTQEQVDSLADENRDLLHEYRNVLYRIESLKIFNNQIEKQVAKQEETLVSLKKQLGRVEVTQRDFVPFMLRMVDTLEEFVALDVPFLPEERSMRIKTIREMMDRPDINLPDKYRRIMEAYQIEMEYGRTIETYEDRIKIGDQEQTVDILRVGRLVLAYQTLDGRSSGTWDKTAKVWQPLPDDYNRSIAHGVKIARKQAPPELFKLPVPAPEKTQ